MGVGLSGVGCGGGGFKEHYNDAILGAMASQITSLTIVYSSIYSCADQRKHQSSASLAFVRGIHRWPVNSPHKGPVTRKMFSFDDVFMNVFQLTNSLHSDFRLFLKKNTWQQLTLQVPVCEQDRTWSSLCLHLRCYAIGSHCTDYNQLTIFWVTGRLGPFDPPFSTYVEFWPLLLGSDVEYWPPPFFKHCRILTPIFQHVEFWPPFSDL